MAGTDPVITCVKTIIKKVGPGVNYITGEDPIVYAGWFRFTYGGFFGPIQYINSMQQIFFPEKPEADGFWFKTKEGCILEAYPAYLEKRFPELELWQQEIGLFSALYLGLRALGPTGFNGPAPIFIPKT